MAKFSLCLGFAITLLVGINSAPSMVYAQTDEETAQPSAQPDQTPSTDESSKPDQGDDQAPSNQENN
jgi:cytoskeletal protein RodZ